MSTSLQDWRKPLWCLAAAALVAGIYFRFKGLGSAPLAVDEYYLANSIGNVLRTGLPAFSCGGFYTRGLLLQYSAAALQLHGYSAEFAPRLICTLSSLLCIPAIFVLGRRSHGMAVALLAVSMVAISVWEIEMARFGRMYAPFQAVFLWYLVFFMRYTADRDKKALWPMILLSIVGPLVWEGGVFLPLANVLAVFLLRWPGNLERRDWIYLACTTALLGVAYWFISTDFRGYNANSWPADYAPSQSGAVPDAVTTLKLPLALLASHRAWALAALLPLGTILYASGVVWSTRSRPFLALGLLCVLIAAAVHQLLAVAVISVLLLLTRLSDLKEFFGRGFLRIHVAVGVSAAYWLMVALLVADWHAVAVGSVSGRAAVLAYQFLRMPDLITVVVRPWARAIPHLGAALLLLIGVAIYRTLRTSRTSDYERILLVVFLVLLFAAGASQTPRQETRYVFFLYPVALIIALSAIAYLAERLASHRAVATGMTAALAVGGFALSEDFQPRHLTSIDSAPTTFRVGLSQGVQSHLVIREDYRSISRWLQEHRTEQDVVIDGVHGLDHYYPGINYFYVDEYSPNFPDWSCRQGTVDRWTNYPLLYSTDTVTTSIAAHARAFLVVFNYDQDSTLAAFTPLHPRIVMSSGDVSIIELKG
jgi:uncharacterized membrane protein SirB2